MRIISLASLAISVPSFIEKPTSLFDKAGASFVPSPVTATTLSNCFKPKTRAYLCKGWLLAITNKFAEIFSKFSKFLTASFLTGFLGLPSLANSSASASDLGHLHSAVSNPQILQ